MIERLRGLLDRPISDGERRRLFRLAAAVVVTAAATGLLTGERGREAQRPERAQPSRPPISPPRPDPPPAAGVEGTTAPTGAPPRDARRVAGRFLSGYLAFLYGKGTARAIAGAGARLVARLARSRVRVPPAARRREPRAVELRARGGDRDRQQVTALIDDGGVARYPISLTLVRRGGRWIVGGGERVMGALAAPRPRRLRAPLGIAAGAAAVVVSVLGALIGVLGADLSCLGGGSSSGPAPSRSAREEIPPVRLRLYRAAGRRFEVDSAFLASVGAQECGHGACRGTNASGCAGPMQIAHVRGTPCSPGSGPTLWERYGLDADGDGRRDVGDPADAIFTAARILRQAKGAPRTGGSYERYRRAACNYYGACAGAGASYAEEVMARAVEYGFRGPGAPPPTDPMGAQPALASAGGCSTPLAGGGPGEVRRALRPRRLEALPARLSAGERERCDARIVPDVVYLARRFGVLVTACYAPAGHEPSGEHPLGAAVDLVPRDGEWSRTLRLAEALGWERSCALQGTAPACADPPFRFIAYNGHPNHGDPLRCVPCAGGPHLHLSWLTSASPGQPENRPRYGYEPASWIEVFAPPAAPGGDRA